MRALVVYESMYGNTHVVADRIAAGIREGAEAKVISVHGVDPVDVARADLIVVGGPTHVHGMSSATSRKSAAADPGKLAESELTLEPDSQGPGLRDWFETLGPLTNRKAAAFDTRIDMAAMLTGRASKAIARRMRSHGMDLIAPPESFLVDRASHLVPGEAERAEDWGRSLAARMKLPV